MRGCVWFAVRGWFWRALGTREEGQSLVEYGLVLILIAIVVLVLLATVGKQASNLYSNLSSGIGSAG